MKKILQIVLLSVVVVALCQGFSWGDGPHLRRNALTSGAPASSQQSQYSTLG